MVKVDQNTLTFLSSGMADSPSPSKTGIVDIWDSALSVSSRVTALSVDFSASSS